MLTKVIATLVVLLQSTSHSKDVHSEKLSREQVIRGLEAVRQKLVEIRKSKKISYLVEFGVEGLELSSGSFTHVESKVIEVYYFENQWVIHERNKNRPNLKVEVSNEKFWFQLNQVGTLFSLTNSHRSPYIKAGDKNAEDQRQVSAIHAAMNIFPGVTFLKILHSSDCAIKKVHSEGDLRRLLLEVPGSELRPHWSGPAEVNACFHQDWKVKEVVVEYNDARKGKYRFEYKVQYPIDGSVIPNEVVYSAKLVDSLSVDKEVWSGFLLSSNDQNPQILQPEYYGIPTSALEGLHPRFSIDFRWIIFSILAAAFLLTGIWLAKRRVAQG